MGVVELQLEEEAAGFEGLQQEEEVGSANLLVVDSARLRLPVHSTLLLLVGSTHLLVAAGQHVEEEDDGQVLADVLRHGQPQRSPLV